MANLVTLQAYAEKCANKLGVTDKVILRWHTKGDSDQCVMKPRTYAHCHMGDSSGFTRGTICLHRGKAIWHKVSEWRNTIAHEVTHLAVKSNHGSVTFAKRMVKLGVANCDEKRLVLANKRHHHLRYRLFTGKFPNRVCHSYCQICGKEVWNKSKGG